VQSPLEYDNRRIALERPVGERYPCRPLSARRTLLELVEQHTVRPPHEHPQPAIAARDHHRISQVTVFKVGKGIKGLAAWGNLLAVIHLII